MVFVSENTRNHSKPVTMLRFAPNGRLLATCANDSELLIWDCRPPPQAYANPDPPPGEDEEAAPPRYWAPAQGGRVL